MKINLHSSRTAICWIPDALRVSAARPQARSASPTPSHPVRDFRHAVGRTTSMHSIAGRRVFIAAVTLIGAAVLAPAAVGGTPPPWPQNFVVRGTDTASFGFAVSVTGPIHVEVHPVAGGPLRVNLLGPHTIEQVGGGLIALDYLVTPQDVQQGALWQVRVGLANPAASTGSGSSVPSAHGYVTLQSPAGNLSALEQQWFALAAQRDATHTAARQQALAQASSAVAAAGAALATAHDKLLADAREKATSALKQLKGSLVNTRALPAAMRSPLDKSAIGVVPPSEIRNMAVAPPPPPPQPPVITQTNAKHGLPRQAVVISGTGFGAQPGAATFLVAPGSAPRPAVIEGWSDNLIVADVPDV
jgi:hypothetical protein